MLLILLWCACIRIRRYMPTNILLDKLRSRRGLKWGLPAMLLAGPYLYATAICTTIVEDGDAGWLILPVVLFVWNAMKFAFYGPVSLVLLGKARWAERRVRVLTHTRLRSLTHPDLA